MQKISYGEAFCPSELVYCYGSIYNWLLKWHTGYKDTGTTLLILRDDKIMLQIHELIKLL